MSVNIFIQSRLRNARQKYEAKQQAAMLEMKRHRKGTSEYEDAKRRAAFYHKRLYPKSAYFHDTYDGKSIMSRLGLKWRDERILSHIDANGFMHVTAVKHLLKGIRRRKVHMPTKQELRKLKIIVSNNKELKEMHEFFRLKRDQLVRLLTYALKENEPLRLSL